MQRSRYWVFATMALLALVLIFGRQFTPLPALGEVIRYTALPFSKDEPIASVVFGGDMMFDRSIRSAISDKGGDFIFSCVDPILKSSDLTVANLEGPITAHASRSLGSAPGDGNNYTFTFPISTAELLKSHGIRLVTLGNNHILNFQYDGVRSTIDALDRAGVGYFGDPISHTTKEADIRGIRLSFIGYNEFDPDGAISAASTTLSAVAHARAAGLLPVVFAHWGDEYLPEAPERVVKLAHIFIDAGAELVVGSHPHVVEQSEEYNGKTIYYSLGNFVFDQYWMDSVRNGLLLRVVFTPKGVHSIEEFPIRLQRDRSTCLAE